MTNSGGGFGAVFWLNFHHARRAKSDEPGSASSSAHGGAQSLLRHDHGPTLLLQLLAAGSAAGRTRRSRISRGIGADGWMRCLGYGAAAAAAAAELVTDGKLHDVRRMFYDRCAVG